MELYTKPKRLVSDTKLNSESLSDKAFGEEKDDLNGTEDTKKCGY